MLLFILNILLIKGSLTMLNACFAGVCSLEAGSGNPFSNT